MLLVLAFRKAGQCLAVTPYSVCLTDLKPYQEVGHALGSTVPVAGVNLLKILLPCTQCSSIAVSSAAVPPLCWRVSTRDISRLQTLQLHVKSTGHKCCGPIDSPPTPCQFPTDSLLNPYLLPGKSLSPPIQNTINFLLILCQTV